MDCSIFRSYESSYPLYVPNNKVIISYILSKIYMATKLKNCIHTCTYALLGLETSILSVQPPKSSIGAYPPNQGTLNNLFTNIELKPGSRADRQLTIEGKTYTSASTAPSFTA